VRYKGIYSRYSNGISASRDGEACRYQW